MNRTLILGLLFLLLGVGAYFVINNQKHSGSVDLTFDTNFNVENVDDVYKIFIADRKGNTTTLFRKEKYWVTQDNKKVREYPMKFILDVLDRVEYKYLLSEPESKNVVKRLAVSGIKVEVYDKAENNLLTFYVGPNANDHEGTYFIKEGSDKPQLVNLPNHVGELRTIFEMKGDEWWDRTLFEYEKDDIKSISIEYPKQTINSFKLSMDKGKVSIQPLDKFAKINSQEPNDDLVEIFLEEFEQKIAENFRNNLTNPDSLLNKIPFAIVSVENAKGEKQEVTFVPVISNVTDMEGNPLSGNAALMRYYSKDSNGDIYLTQHQAIQGIFRSYESFFRK